MIIVSGKIITENNIIIAYPQDTIEWVVLNKLSSSEDVYEYASLSQLKFEIQLRKEIIVAARELDGSGLRFRTFKSSICNEDFWHRTEQGGFLLKESVTSSSAIRDIFINGSKYGTECSTAIVIIYYKALLDIYPEELFNKAFQNINLMNWHYIDDDLDIVTYKNISDAIPGDCRYIENPDFNPENSEWRGENIIDLGDGMYFGHGLGITSINNIIDYLNDRRKPNSTQSAHAKNNSSRPNFKHLSDLYINYHERLMWETYRYFH
jgi:protein-glutamine gamma-glutamyltransferase